MVKGIALPVFPGVDLSAVMEPPRAALSQSLVDRPCPLCGSEDRSRVVFESHLDEARLGRMSYASRKLPEFMNLRLVQCPACDLLYAPRIPSIEFLRSAYRSAGYDSEEEARFAAESYARAVDEYILPRLPDRSGALEVGAGNGAFLARLRAAGFDNVVGVEPSAEAVNAASPDVKPLLRLETFDAARHAAASYSVVAAFQTLEHIENPLKFLADANRLLKPGGTIMVVTHNYRHWLMRLMGRTSPIVDIEHLQLFSPRSLSFALARAGFDDARIRAFRNTYPAHYWVKLAPLPAPLKLKLIALLRRGGRRSLGAVPISLKVGNMLGWAKK